MNNKTEKLLTTSATRSILSDWKVLASLIRKYSKTQTESAQDTEAPQTPVLTDAQIQEALSGPLHVFFKQSISAYMRLSLVRMNLNIKEDETLKENKANLNAVPDTLLKKISENDLRKIHHELDQLTKSTEENWAAQYEAWSQQILQAFNESELPFSDVEINEFINPEPISEIYDRFTDLSLEQPKLPSKIMDFVNYFTLKSTILAHSSLSRQHLPHEPSEIKKILSTHKKLFAEIGKMEKEMNQQHSIQLSDTLALIHW